MDASTTVNFWDRLWRSSGIIFGIFFVLAYVFYSLQPKVGASADTLVSFYDGQRMRILMATMLFGVAVAAVLLVLVGGTTWASNGIWAPSGEYTRFVSPIIGLVWIVAFSRVLLTRRSPSTTPHAPEPPAAAPAS